MLFSREYKRRVLAQQQLTNGELKHVEWDGWGMAGLDTTVYLVFDPTDSLAIPARDRSSGIFNGIPCEVPLVTRLESHWYVVPFYTNDDWENCSTETKVDRTTSKR